MEELQCGQGTNPKMRNDWGASHELRRMLFHFLSFGLFEEDAYGAIRKIQSAATEGDKLLLNLFCHATDWSGFIALISGGIICSDSNVICLSRSKTGQGVSCNIFGINGRAIDS